MEPVRITIDEKFLSHCGSGTLSGTISTRQGFPPRVTLVFPESDLDFCRKNGGPLEMIVNEHAIPCLLEDVLILRSYGVEVEIERAPRT